MKNNLKIKVSVFLTILLVIIVVFKRTNSPLPIFSLVNNLSLSSLPTRDVSKIDTSHLANKMVPPTNKWFSGIALQKDPKIIFPMPLGFVASNTSFSYGLPDVTVSPDTINGGMTQRVTTSIEGASNYKISRYDELSVDITYFNSVGIALGTVTLLEGSPYVQFTAQKATNLSVEMLGTNPEIRESTAIYKTKSTNYYLSGFEGSKLFSLNQKINVKVPTSGFMSFYALPASLSQDPLANDAGNRIIGAKVKYSKNDDSYKTEITITTSNNKPTMYGTMPHQNTVVISVFEYATIYGQQKISQGNSFSFTTPIIPVNHALNLSKLSSTNKALLINTLRREINATNYIANDTYYSGKELYRSAQMLQLSRQLNEDNIASTIQTKLRQQLELWLSTGEDRSSKYFYYDTHIQSIVGVKSSFGSEEINDHNFHYGYFIYAASILARYDSNFLDRYKSVVNLIVADIANYNTGDVLPLRRVFDPYMSHSWASGSAPFNDGNNLESSSEAINAWIGVSLWAEQTRDPKLAEQAGWLLSAEAAAADKYWMNIDTTNAPYNQGYGHSIVPLNWSGKRNYSTFFSAEPLASLGIQLIPMSPTMLRQLSNNLTAQKAHINEVSIGSSYDKPFGDYLLMYTSISGDTNLLVEAQKLQDDTIDSANSRSYLYAWIMSQLP